MLCLWLIASLVHGCLSGGLYPTSAVSSVEAHGPLARLALHHGVTSPSVAHVYAAHSPHVAPVYQVPTVPVLKYTTQPRYVQRLVDVTNAQVAVAKLQVRRPAIQKQFYDIEERTIVRPVGSAVLELDEPVSKQFVSPFSVVPAGHHSTAQFHRPLLYPVGSYPLVSYGPLQVPVQHYPVSIQSPQQYPIIPQPLQPYPSIPLLPQQYPSTSQQPQQYPTISQPPQQFPSIPQPPQQYPTTSQPPQQVPTIPQVPQEPDNTEPRPPQQFPFEPQPSPEDSFNTEFDSSDSVVVDNPDFTKSSKSNDDESLNDNKNEGSFDEFEREVLSDKSESTEKNTEQDRVVQNIINDFENLQLLRMFSSQTGSERPLQRSQQRPNFRVLLEPPKILERPQQTQTKPSDETNSFQRSKETGLGDSLTQTLNNIETSSQRAPSSTTETELPSLYRSYLNHLRDNQLSDTKAHSTDEVIPSVRQLSPEQSQENQRKLLELLTGRGEVSEVGLARSGESAVRGRVLSVTPAPPCAEGEERVNTRRVVVSRPVHTVEEVHVQRPFTQVQRVAVHEPVHTHHIATLAPILYH